ncbi:MAG TPA: hypothetical protein VFC78_11760 [Tepidisphaeraceae bacterium]|nr:hypothetical protein [Tepidisphaeraceae bacterium]
MRTQSLAVLDALKSLYEAEANSLLQFVGVDSPYLDGASEDMRATFRQMVAHLASDQQEVARMIGQLGDTPAIPPPLGAEERYIPYLSLKFLLPKLREAKEMMVRRYENALRFVDGEPEVIEMLERHLAQMRVDLVVLKRIVPEGGIRK